VPLLKRLERTFTYERGAHRLVRVADRAEFDTPQTFETALVIWGKWERPSERELVITEPNGAVRVLIDTGGQPFDIKPKPLEADVRTPKRPLRLGFVLTQPVASAQVTMTFTPALGEPRQTPTTGNLEARNCEWSQNSFLCRPPRQLARLFRTLTVRREAGLINTPLQRGESRLRNTSNRFNGFQQMRQTVKTVGVGAAPLGTPLKRVLMTGDCLARHGGVPYPG